MTKLILEVGANTADLATVRGLIRELREVVTSSQSTGAFASTATSSFHNLYTEVTKVSFAATQMGADIFSAFAKVEAATKAEIASLGGLVRAQAEVSSATKLSKSQQAADYELFASRIDYLIKRELQQSLDKESKIRAADVETLAVRLRNAQRYAAELKVLNSFSGFVPGQSLPIAPVTSQLEVYLRNQQAEAVARAARQAAINTDFWSQDYNSVANLRSVGMAKSTAGPSQGPGSLGYVGGDRLTTTELRAWQDEASKASMAARKLAQEELELGKASSLTGASKDRLNRSVSELTKRKSEAHVSTKRLSDIQGELQGALRGTAGALGGLWLSYGQILPMLASFAAMMSVKKTLTFGSDLEYELATIKGVANTTSGVLSVARAQMLELASSSSLYSVLELAKGLRILVQSGMSVGESMAALPAVMKLATLGELSVASAATTAQTVLHAFSLEVSDIPRVIDMLVVAANISAVSVSEMSSAITTSSQVFALYGTKVEEVSALLAVLAQRHIVGSNAGTVLTNMFRDLGGRSEKAKDMIKALGISVYDAEGDMKPIVPLLGEIHDKLSMYNKESQVMIEKTWMSRQAQKAFAIAMDEARSALPAMFAQIKAAGDSAGTANRMTKELLDTVKGQAVSAFHNLEVTITRTFSSMHGQIRSAADSLAALVKTDDFQRFVDTTIGGSIKVITKLVEHKDAVYEVVKAYAAYKAMRMTVSLLEAGSAAVGIAALGGPVPVTVAALATLGTAYAVFEGHTSKLATSTGYLKDRFLALGDAMTPEGPAMSKITGGMARFNASVVQWLKEIVNPATWTTAAAELEAHASDLVSRLMIMNRIRAAEFQLEINPEDKDQLAKYKAGLAELREFNEKGSQLSKLSAAMSGRTETETERLKQMAVELTETNRIFEEYLSLGVKKGAVDEKELERLAEKTRRQEVYNSSLDIANEQYSKQNQLIMALRGTAIKSEAELDAMERVNKQRLEQAGILAEAQRSAAPRSGAGVIDLKIKTDLKKMSSELEHEEHKTFKSYEEFTEKMDKAQGKINELRLRVAKDPVMKFTLFQEIEALDEKQEGARVAGAAQIAGKFADLVAKTMPELLKLEEMPSVQKAMDLFKGRGEQFGDLTFETFYNGMIGFYGKKREDSSGFTKANEEFNRVLESLTKMDSKFDARFEAAKQKIKARFAGFKGVENDDPLGLLEKAAMGKLTDYFGAEQEEKTAKWRRQGEVTLEELGARLASRGKEYRDPLQALEAENKAKLAKLAADEKRDKKAEDDHFARIDAGQDQEIKLAEELSSRKLAIEKLYLEASKTQAETYAKQKADLERKNMLQGLGYAADTLRSLAALQATGSEKTFKRGQQLQIAAATVDTARGAVGAFADTPGPGWVRAAALIAALAAGAVQIQAIRSQKFTPQAHDGLDYVPKQGTYVLEAGERVVKKEDNKKLEKALDEGMGSRQPVVVNIPVVIQTMDGKTVHETLIRHSDSVAMAYQKAFNERGGRLGHAGA